MSVMTLIAAWVISAIGILVLLGLLALAFCWCVDRIVGALGVQKILFQFIVAIVSRRLSTGESLDFAIRETAKRLSANK